MAQAKKPIVIITWILQIVVAAIFIMAMLPKLTGADETKALFDVLGVEPMGRYAVGVAELIAVVLIINPKTSAVGAVFSLGVISGAIVSHITKLGINIDPVALGRPELVAIEGPSMFVMAMIVFLASLGVAILRRAQLPIIGAKFAAQSSAQPSTDS